MNHDAYRNPLQVRSVVHDEFGRPSQRYFVPSVDGAELYEFDGLGRHQSTFDTLTGVKLLSFTYDAAGRLTKITDRDANDVTISRPAADQVVITGPDGQATTLTLNPDGWAEEIRSPGGAIHQAAYATGGLLQSFTDPRSNQSWYTYDAKGRLATATGRDEKTTTLTPTDLTDGYEVGVTTPMGREVVYRLTQDADGTVRHTVTDPTGLARAEERRPNGTSIVTVDGGTLTQNFAADPRWGMTAPRVASATVQAPGKAAVTSTLSTSVTLSDPADPLSVATKTDTSAIGARTWTSAYNATAKTITATSPVGRQTVTTLDVKGHVVSEKVGNLDPVTYSYDARGRLATITQGTRVTTITYNAQGFVGSVEDPEGRVTSYTYDLDGRATQATGPAGTASATYDQSGNVSSITPPGRPAYGLGTAVDDRLSSYSLPDVGAGAASIGYTLNDDRQYSGATFPGGGTASFAYDTAGRLTTLTRGTATTSFDWTGGRLASITAPSGVVTTPGYSSGIPTSTTWSGPLAGSVTVGFDNELRVTSETVGGTSAVSFGYDNDGLLTSAGALGLTRSAQTGLLTGTSLGQIATTLAYSGLGEVSDLTATASGSAVYDVDFTGRDGLGRITERDETIGGVASTDEYAYEPTGRLDTITRDGTQVASFDYDGAGNLTSQTLGATTTIATYNGRDEIQTWGSLSFTHSALGERTSTTDSSTSQTTDYIWDAGRLAGADLADGTEIRYLLDGTGRRIARKVNGTITQGYLWSGDHVVATTDGTGTVDARFVYGTRANVPDYVVKSGITYRILTDERGSPRLVANTTTGAVAQRLDYDAWGRITADSSPGFTPFGFAGGLVDPDTDLVLFGARSYDPTTARWMSRDGVGFAGGANHYAYADADPINRIDPTGYGAIDCFQDLMALAGMIPGIGAAFDIANALLYAARGKWGDAALALASSLLPFALGQMKGVMRFGDEFAEMGAKWGDEAPQTADVLRNKAVGDAAADAIAPGRPSKVCKHGSAGTSVRNGPDLGKRDISSLQSYVTGYAVCSPWCRGTWERAACGVTPKKETRGGKE